MTANDIIPVMMLISMAMIVYYSTRTMVRFIRKLLS